MRTITFFKQKGKRYIFAGFSHFYQKGGCYEPCGENDERMDEFFNYAIFLQKDNGDWICNWVKGPAESVEDFQRRKTDEYLLAGYRIVADRDE